MCGHVLITGLAVPMVMRKGTTSTSIKRLLMRPSARVPRRLFQFPAHFLWAVKLARRTPPGSPSAECAREKRPAMRRDVTAEAERTQHEIKWKDVDRWQFIFLDRGGSFCLRRQQGGKKKQCGLRRYIKRSVLFSPPVRRMDRQKKAGKGLETFHEGKTITFKH